MDLLMSLEDHFQYLDDLVQRKPKAVLITSFGIYAGIASDGRDITSFGEKYRSKTRDFLESLRSISDVRILIGVATYKSCKNNQFCYDCEKSYLYQLIRLINHRNYFPDFKWKVINNSHLKCVLFFYDNNEILGVVGGRNLNDSSWVDASFKAGNDVSCSLYRELIPVWKKSYYLDDSAVNKILNDQNISEFTIDSIFSEFNKSNEYNNLADEIASCAQE